MAAAARAFTLSRLTNDMSFNPRHQLPRPLISRHLSLPSSFQRRRLACSGAATTTTIRCLVSGVDGGADESFVSTPRKSDRFDRGFSVIANMLKRIEPLECSVISKGVSESAKDSMKQTISTMLGLLPSDHFSVTVRVCKAPLDRLLASSIITGYTLWNAEYRISLMRNFDIPTENSMPSEINGSSDSVEGEERESGNVFGVGVGDQCLESKTPQVFKDLSPEALSYIERLKSELTNVKEELKAQKQENLQLEYETGHQNDLLDYLRSLDSNMVNELSRPSSLEVEEIIHQLVQNILQRFYKDGDPSESDEDIIRKNVENVVDSDGEIGETVATSRDYLAKLLFWCMLLGHHLRGLENRLHLSCVVGLL